MISETRGTEPADTKKQAGKLHRKMIMMMNETSVKRNNVKESKVVMLPSLN